MLTYQIPTIICTLLTCASGGAAGAAALSELLGRGRRAQLPLAVAALLCALGSIVALCSRFQRLDRVFNAFGQISSTLTQSLIAGLVLVAVAIALVVLVRSRGIGRPVAALALVCGLAGTFVSSRLLGGSTLIGGERVVLAVYCVALGAAVGAGLWWVVAAVRGNLAVARGCARVTAGADVALGICSAAWIAVLAASQTATLGSYTDPTRITTQRAQASDVVGTVLGGDLALPFWIGAILVGVAIPLALGIVGSRGKATPATSRVASVVALVGVIAGSAAFQVVYVLSALVGRVSVFN